MRQRIGSIGVVFSALTAVALLGSAKPAHAGNSNFLGDAASCVSVQGNKITNTCSYSISLMWCAVSNQGDDCDKGFNKASNSVTAGNFELTHALPNPGLFVQSTQGIACKKGPNRPSGFALTTKNGYSASEKTARCDADQKLYSFSTTHAPQAIDVPVVQAPDPKK